MMREKKRYSIRIQLMAINITITLISFLLYGGLFILSVSLLIGKYINTDLDFFLTETCDNLDEPYEYMEEMIYETRNSTLLMDYLAEEEHSNLMVEITDEFAQAIDISNSKNNRIEGKPIVENVYLCKENGTIISNFYYTLVTSEIKKTNQIVTDVWELYRQSKAGAVGFETYFHEYEDKIYMASPIMNDEMDAQGTIIMAINPETIQSIMSEVDNYQGAFWFLYNDKEQIIRSNTTGLQLIDITTLKEEHSQPYLCEIQGESYRVFQKELGLDTNIMVGIPENHAFLILSDSLKIYVIMLFVVFLTGLLSFAIFTYKITKPVREVVEKIRKVQEGDFETKMPAYDSKEFFEISSGFNRMTTEINHLIKEVYEKQLVLKELELKFLQSQVNPHFIFNVLNSIALQAQLDGNEQISRTISTFSRLIQAKIYRSDREMLQVQQELEYVKYYLEIQNFRYGDKLSYEMELDPKILECYIPKLCVQMVVENAVIHGIEKKIGNGKVKISGCLENDLIVIEITDDGVGFEQDGEIVLPMKATEADDNHNHVGINNIQAILQMRYGKDYGLSIYSIKNEGTRVTIRIPYEEKVEDKDGVIGVL